MTLDIKSVLIVGGGIGGMATAIALRGCGIAVDLIDIDADWRVLGSGITMTAPSLRAYRRIGLYQAIANHGTVAKGTRMHRYSGEIVGMVQEPPVLDGLPASGGIMRPVLHQIMADEVRRLGVQLRLGVTWHAIKNVKDHVEVDFSDGTSASYDLMVGADGIYSKLRRHIFPQAGEPRFTGMSGWRITGPRPPGLDMVEVYGGAGNLAGITPCAPDRAYLWMNESTPEKVWIDEKDQSEIVSQLLAEFNGNVAYMRDAIRQNSHISYRPFEVFMLDKPWNVGRVVLVGDAVHATTPQLASGAGMAVEDAIVLAEELSNVSRDLPMRLSGFAERRYDRCRFVVETSEAMGEAAKQGNSMETGRRYGEAMLRLSQPI